MITESIERLRKIKISLAELETTRTALLEEQRTLLASFSEEFASEIGGMISIRGGNGASPITPIGRKPNSMDERNAEIMMLKESGISQRAIAEKMKLSTSIVYRVLKNKGRIKEPGKTAKIDETRIAKMIELSKDGSPRYEIARLCGVSGQTVSKYLKRAKKKDRK